MENSRSNIDSSVLFRCSQKHYDSVLAKYDIGFTQFIFLTQIYENEGISMNELATQGCFDKGTITKSISKLQELDYVKIENSETDRRAKSLFTTSKAREILPKLYSLSQEWTSYLTSDLTDEEKDKYVEILTKIINKARDYSSTANNDEDVKFYGLQKLSLLDYPGHMAATLFTGGCNFRCPFCHNKSLVFLDDNAEAIDHQSILDYLLKRKGVLDGVCVTGGEPLLYPSIKNYLKVFKEMGLSVKLDTNGTNPKVLKELVDKGLVDYVAMDIKNCPKKYPMTIGIEDYDLTNIKESIKYLLDDNVDYEFRTTVVKEFHEADDFKEIGKLIKGAKRYFLQKFEDHGSCIKEGLSAPSDEDLKQFKDIVKDYVQDVHIRGVEE